MANKPADRNTDALIFDKSAAQFNAQVAQWPTVVVPSRVMLAHANELATQAERRKPKPPVKLSKPDKMWLYVDGKRQIQVDADKAHALAETYMAQGQSAWLSRKLIRMEA